MLAFKFQSVTLTYPSSRGALLLRDRLTAAIQGSDDSVKALDGVTFAVHKGESVGLIGRNGSGKSTLLAVAAGLCKPDSGLVEVQGSVGPLLALGAGFHPDLTGTENVLLNAALLGVDEALARENLTSIGEFAGIGNAVHRPLRTYSTGMVMRLAFAVAVHVDPDNLLIDEVLAVGDHAFLTKCIERLAQFRSARKTLLCVSHDSHIIRALCDRAIWIEGGRVISDGPVSAVIETYERWSSAGCPASWIPKPGLPREKPSAANEESLSPCRAAVSSSVDTMASATRDMR